MSPATVADEREHEIAEGTATNGKKMAPAPKPGPRLPQRIRTLRLPDEYGDAGFEVSVWVNCPSRLVDDALMAAAPQAPTYADLEERARMLQIREQSGDDVADQFAALDEETASRLNEFRAGVKEAEKRRLEALSKIVLSHNGWCDEDGTPYPPASEPRFWEEIPTELAAAIMILLRREAAKLPNSLMRTGRR